MTDLPRVTVVIVTAVPRKPSETMDHVMVKPLKGPVLRAVHSVEQQTYPRDLVDVNIIRNVEGYPLEDMQRFGVEHATTSLVAFLAEDEYWFPNHLAWAVHTLGQGEKIANFYGLAILIRKEAYLRENS